MSTKYKKFLDSWYVNVVPYMKNKDYDTARYEALVLLSQLTEEIGERKLSYEIWKLYHCYWAG